MTFSSLRPSHCAEDNAWWGGEGGVTCNDDSHDTSTSVVLIRLCKNKVVMGTGYHHLCGPEIPDSDGLVETAILSD